MTDDNISGDARFKFVFSESEWRAVGATFPNPVATFVSLSPVGDKSDSGRFSVSNAEIDQEREALEAVASAYLNLNYHHQRRNINESPTVTWKRTRKMIAADLASAEKAGALASILSDLREDLRHADAAVEGFGILGHVHQGRGNPARDWLYDEALAMWQRLGGRLTVSRRSYGTKPASGPMINFMNAVLLPIMKDDAPGVEAIAKLVKNKRAKVGA